MTEIVKQCSEAAEAGRIYSIDTANTHTLHFWANTVASALKQNSGEKHKHTYSLMRENFGKLLTRLLLNSDCYDHLDHFEQLYKTLEENGVLLPALAAPLRKLMMYNIESETTLDVQSLDLNTQRRFFTSQLWKSFEKRRAVCLLRQAKDEEHGEKRDRLLKLWDAVPEETMCSSTRADVEMARSLFLSTLPLPSRVTYALGDASRMKFAAGWKADFDFNTLLYFGTTPSSFEGLTYVGFRDIYNFILIHDMRELVTNAIMKTILDYGVSLAVYTKKKKWWADFLKIIVSARLGLLMSWCETETPQFDDSLIDAESLEKVAKETAKLLANVKGDHSWMTALKQRSKEIKAAKDGQQPRPVLMYGKQAAPSAAENKTLSAAAENTTSDEALLPQETGVPSVDAATSSAKPLSLVSTSEASPQPSATKAESVDKRYVPTCAVGDIVRVQARRSQYNGFKAKVLAVLTGDVRVEMLEGPTVRTKESYQRFKFLQVKKLIETDDVS